ncbi:MAG: ATP-binding protein [Burkholderiales bacterium]
MAHNPRNAEHADTVAGDRLNLRNENAELRRLASWLHDWTGAQGLSQQLAHRIDLASHELVTNIIDYAYSDQARHCISVRVHRTNGKVTLAIEDDGNPFDPSAAPTPETPKTLEEAPIRGRGIHLARQSSDEMRHHRSEGKNHLILVWDEEADRNR